MLMTDKASGSGGWYLNIPNQNGLGYHLTRHLLPYALPGAAQWERQVLKWRVLSLIQHAQDDGTYQRVLLSCFKL